MEQSLKRGLSRRDFMKMMGKAGVGIAAASALGSASGNAATARKPNIIFILADDLGYGDLGCYGQEKIKTPQIDKMASEGLKFNRFYAGCAVCLPSRSTLMTGLHTGHARNRINGSGDHEPIHEEDICVSKVLKTAGYKTGMVGKWALGDDFLGNANEKHNLDGPGALYKHGWDYYFGEPNQTLAHNYWPFKQYEYDRYGKVRGTATGDKLEQITYRDNGKKHTHYAHDLQTEHSLKFIDAYKDEPFFLYIAYTIPHADFNPPSFGEYADKPWTDKQKAIASMISMMDRDVGKIIDRLKQYGIDQNTMVVFTSDNGPRDEHEFFNSTGGLEGAKSIYKEGGLRVPAVVRWPGTVAAGRTTDEILAFWDVMPTLSELAGISCPAPIDGISFVPTLLNSGVQQKHKYLYFEEERKGKLYQYVVKGAGETRSNKEIMAEAHSDQVTVPKWTPKPVTVGAKADLTTPSGALPITTRSTD